MILNEIHMKNFKSHEDTKIQFNEGITIITGENGAGKTTIFEAIQYALFKKTNNNQSQILKHNTNNMVVELTFTEKGNTYKVNRTRKGNTTTSKLYKKDTDYDGFQLYIEGNKETDRTITQLISMDNDLFLNAIYIKQGEMTDLISKSSSERKRLIARLLNIDDLEKCWKQMPQIIKQYENRESELKGIVGMMQDIDLEIRKSREDIVSLEIESQKLLKEKESLEIEKENIRIQKDKMEKSKKEYSLLHEKHENDKATLNRLLKEKQMLDKKYWNILSYEEEIESLNKSLENINIYQMEDKIASIKSHMMYLQQQNNEYMKSLDNLKDVDGKCPTCQSPINEKQKFKLIEEFNENIKNNEEELLHKKHEIQLISNEKGLAEEKQDKMRLLQSMIMDKAELEEKRSQINEEIKKYSKRIGRIVEQLESNHFNDKHYIELSQKEQSLNLRLNHALERIGIVKGKLETIKQNMQKLSDDKHEIERINSELDNLDDYLTLLKECRELYSKEGIQSLIRSKVKPLIEKNTKMQFNKFNFDYSDLLLDDDYNISLVGDDGEINMSLLSGGEQISMALALRLGITETIAKGNIDCLLLDEPTNHLDRVRIHELSTLLSDINIVPQVLVVTHDSEFEKIADTLLSVVKDKGSSVVV